MRRTAAEESKQIANLLKQKPEIDSKLKYYTGVLKANEAVYNSIQDRLERGYTKETYRILGIPVSKRIMLDELDRAELEKKMLEIDQQVFAQKQYYEMWLKRSKEYENKFDEITRECNENYDEIYEAAQKVAESNIRLRTTINQYENPDNDQRIKNEFYLYIKQEVENARTYSGGKTKPKFTGKHA